MHRSLTTIQSMGSDSIYDEVCSSDIKDLENCFDTPPTPITNMHFQRRWSSPAIELPGLKLLNSHTIQPPSAPYAGRRCLREHPLPSLPASSPDSEVILLWFQQNNVMKLRMYIWDLHEKITFTSIRFWYSLSQFCGVAVMSGSLKKCLVSGIGVRVDLQISGFLVLERYCIGLLSHQGCGNVLVFA